MFEPTTPLGGGTAARLTMVGPLCAIVGRRQDMGGVLGADGTLSKAVPSDSPARGKVQAKTGTYFIDNTMNKGFVMTSKALAGYMTTARNRELAFALFVNNVHLEKPGDTARAGK